MFSVSITTEGQKFFREELKDKGWKITASRFAVAMTGNNSIQLTDYNYDEHYTSFVYEGDITLGYEPDYKTTVFRCDLAPGVPKDTISYREVFLIGEYKNKKYIVAAARLAEEDDTIEKRGTDSVRYEFQYVLDNFLPDLDPVYAFKILEIDRFDAPILRTLLKAGNNCSIQLKNGKITISNISVPPVSNGGAALLDQQGGISPITDNSDRLGGQAYQDNAIIRYYSF